MTAITIEITESIDKIVIFNQTPKKSFVQLHNWLAAKLGQRLPATEKNAWGLLAYLLSLDPLTIDDISPEILSKKTGHSVRSLYNMFKFLMRMGHMRIIKIRDRSGRFIKTEYEVYSIKNLWRKNPNWQEDDIIDKNGIVGKTVGNKNSKLQTNTLCTNMQEDDIIGKNAQNSGGSYNARDISSNTRNTTNEVGKSVPTDKKSSTPTGKDFFLEAKNFERTKTNWVLVNSLIKYFGAEKGFSLFGGVFKNKKIGIDKKASYLWGAIKKQKAALKDRQSLIKKTPDENQPSNPQKNMADQEEMKKNIEAAKKYNNKPHVPKSIESKKIMARMKRFAEKM